VSPPSDDIPQRESRFQSNIVILFGALLFFFGCALNVEMYLDDAWPTSLFFILMGIGLLVVLAGVWSRRSWITRDKPRGLLKRNIVFFVFPAVFLLFLAYRVGMGVQTIVDERMTWSYGNPPEGSTRAHIVLRFLDYPDHVVGIYSSDLGEKLQSLRESVVDVRFLVTTDFGTMRGFQVVQIGPFAQWDGQAEYSGTTDHANAPPWME